MEVRKINLSDQEVKTLYIFMSRLSDKHDLFKIYQRLYDKVEREYNKIISFEKNRENLLKNQIEWEYVEYKSKGE